MTRSIVIDCSVSASWFMPREQNTLFEKILSDILDGQISMTVPGLWWYEVMNVVRSAVLRQKIKENDVQSIFLFLRDIPKTVVEIGEPGQFGILKLAMDTGLSVYDAAYLYLAVSSGFPLITSDRDLLGLKNKYSIMDVSGY